MKKILGVHSAPSRHWVGDGFPVRSMFSYERHGQAISPFLLLDYAGPMHFAPGHRPRGVGEHPHRGFETVTIVYQGEVEHLDSTGGGGRIGPGDVQWMTAASGILHQEFHSEAFTRRGGTLEMVQLWVNLPATNKMSAPGYQPLLDLDIPAIDLPEGAGTVRVIAGQFEEHRGPANTHTPMDVWDLQLAAGHPPVRLALADGWTSMLVVLHGNVRINGQQDAEEAQLVLLDRAGDGVELEARTDSTLLVLHGEPIDEPIVGHGPFVMNTTEEIREAVRDFSSGHFGRLPA
ncbi:pirin family protein [Thioalkalivibrio nitratireducens]|nr:pirin family protein [Thioalkalivibrio nitratireducens]